jgi:murein DD-endopeptidase MepM/ murein hydrolase activator NlpD
LLKLEITQKVKLVNSPNTDRDALASESPAIVPDWRSGLLKIASVFGNRRSRTSAVMLGLTVSMGISSLPTNYIDAVAATAESATKSPATLLQPDVRDPDDRYVEQLRSDVSAMQARYAQPSSVLIAQSMPPRAYPISVSDRAGANNLQYGGEVSVPIEVAAPKTKTFKSVATAQPYFQPIGADGESSQPDRDTPANKFGQTTIGFSWPAAGKLTSRYGRRWGRMHKGIDIAGPIGTPISAAADGTVTVSGWSGGYGNLVEVRHIDGTITRYGHNSRLSVSVGQTVRQGQQVAEMGSTGHSTGSHLHFEIHPSGGAAVNPIAHLPANS